MNARRLLDALSDSSPDAKATGERLDALAQVHILSAKSVDPNKSTARIRKATRQLGQTIARTRAAADLAGRVSVLLQVKGPRPDKFTTQNRSRLLSFASEARRYRTGDVIPVVFLDAVADLSSREPVVAKSLLTAAEEVRKAYGGYLDEATGEWVYPHGFSLAKTQDLEIVKRVQKVLTDATRDGIPTDAVIETLTDWSRGYAVNVVRTNVATAYSAGRMRQAEELTTSGFEVGFTFETAHDDDVRRGRPKDHGENHQALAGISAPVGDAFWEYFSPPLGYMCRCYANPVIGGPWTKNALSQAISRGARAHPGFGSRPDRSTYGS